MSDGSQAASTSAVDRILEHNRAHVARTPAREFPPAEQRRLAVVACYDPRLDVLLWPALGLTPGEAFVLRTAGALVQPQGGVMRSLGLAVFMFGVTEIVVVGHAACRMAMFKNNEFVDLFRRRGVAREAFGTDDLREWAGAIQDPVRGVQASIRNIAAAPYLPKDVAVSGLVLDETTGALTLVQRGEAAETPVAPVDSEKVVPPEVPQGATATITPPTIVAPGASSRASTPAAPPPSPEMDALMAGLGQWLGQLEAKRQWRGQVAQLRQDLAMAPSVKDRLSLLETFARKASNDSRDVIRAFERIKQQVAAMPSGKIPEELLRFFQRWSGGTR
ncbi:MAG TPA: carbonic anhydrase [Candidatus Polarisedimenticolaceae bacterium]|nr:carbonic anhydrase [Candidatus Polarisedimenticolaceae bacterium]